MRKRCIIVAAALLLTGCDGNLSTLTPAGPVASEIALLWWIMLAGSGAITILMIVLVSLSLGRPRATSVRFWTHGMGLAFSMVILTSLLAVGLWIGERILPRDDGAVAVQAHAWQWGWTFTHEGPDGVPVETDDMIHIPAVEPVDVLITSEDVIHAFWVPQLAGKMDAIPGRTNRARLQADEPGQYEGLCAEFCGIGHARMRFSVQAHATWPPDLTSDGAEE